MLKLATKFVPRQPAFEVAHRAGFRCAELWLDGNVLRDWQAVAAVARHYPFEYVLHFPNQRDLPPDTAEQAVKLHSALGCRCMVIHQPLLDRYEEILRGLDPGLRLAVENHRLSPDEFEAWAGRNRALALDVEHLWLMTLRDAPLEQLLQHLRRFLGRYGDRLCHVHLPGYHPGFRTHRPMYCAREMVFPVLSLLAEFAFDGLIVSEADTPYQNPSELRMDVLLFDAWREKHDGLSAVEAARDVSELARAAPTRG